MGERAAHLAAKPDGLTDLDALKGVHRNWGAMLRHGLERHERTGRSLGDAGFVAELERITGRELAPKKPGRKPKTRK